MTDTELKIGSKLPNGATIIDIKQDRLGHCFVLCLYGESPYVTWYIEKETQSCYWGNYFIDLERAVEDLRKRTE